VFFWLIDSKIFICGFLNDVCDYDSTDNDRGLGGSKLLYLNIENEFQSILPLHYYLASTCLLSVSSLVMYLYLGFGIRVAGFISWVFLISRVGLLYILHQEWVNYIKITHYYKGSLIISTFMHKRKNTKDINTVYTKFL